MNIPQRDLSVKTHGNFVDGREVEGETGEVIEVRNPATGAVLATVPESTRADVDRAMKSARAAFESKEWGGMDLRARVRLVNRIADAFEAALPELYKLETQNNGRPLIARIGHFISSTMPPAPAFGKALPFVS